MKRHSLLKRLCVGSALLIAVGTTIVPGQIATASITPTSHPISTAQGVESDEDIEQIDQRAATSTEVGSWTQRFNFAVDHLRQDLPESFGGALVDPSQSSGRVWFVGEAPSGIERYFADVDNVTLEGGAAVTEAVIYQAASDTMDTLIKSTGGGVPLVTYPVPEQAKIVVEFATANQSEVEKAVANGSRNLLDSGITVELSPSDDFSAGDPELFHGARPLAGVCTGAFPVKRKGGAELGILTAAHCPGTGSYDGTSNAFNAPYPYSISTESGPGGGDFRWNHSKYGLSGLTFVAGNQAMRTFNSHSTLSVGSGICGYGKNSDYKCNTVAQCGLSNYTTVPDNGQTYYVGGMCRVTGHVTVPGDSGGPWFLGTTAYGIHYGTVNGHSAFSLVNNALNKTRVNLVIDAGGNTVP